MALRNAFARLGRMEDYDNVQKRLVTVLRKQLEQVPEDVRARILMTAELAGAGEIEETERHLQMAIAFASERHQCPLQRRMHLRHSEQKNRMP